MSSKFNSSVPGKLTAAEFREYIRELDPAEAAVLIGLRQLELTERVIDYLSAINGNSMTAARVAAKFDDRTDGNLSVYGVSSEDEGEAR